MRGPHKPGKTLHNLTERAHQGLNTAVLGPAPRIAIMTKRPTDDDEPPAKKRGSGRQLTKDDASDDEVSTYGGPFGALSTHTDALYTFPDLRWVGSLD